MVFGVGRRLSLVVVAVSLISSGACSRDAVAPQDGLVAVGDDSSVVTAAGQTIAILQNDAVGASNPRIVDGPTHGSAMLDGSTLRFVPAAGYYGRDSLRYVATAGDRTDTATVRYNVMPGPFSATPVMPASALLVQGPPFVVYSPFHLNDAGQVTALVGALADRRAVRWTGGQVDTLASNSAPTWLYAIDNAGDVFGVLDGNVVRWQPGASSAEAVLPFSVDYEPILAVEPSVAVSPGGTVVVLVGTKTQYLVRGGAMDTLHIDGFWGVSGVDDSGDFVGRNADLQLERSRGKVHYATGTNAVFGVGTTLPGGMNSHGAFVGSTTPVPNAAGTPFAYDSRLTDLASVYPSADGMTAINDSGWILGGARTAPDTSALALFVNGAVAPVQSLLADQRLRVQGAARLNNAGQILGLVDDVDGVTRLVLLTPPR